MEPSRTLVVPANPLTKSWPNARQNMAATASIPHPFFVEMYLGRVRVPAGIGPKLARYRGVGDHEADSIGDFFRLDQTAQLRFGQNVLVDVILAQSSHHRCIGKARVDDATTDTVEI